MDEEFNPYREWLGIDIDDVDAITYYDLLGIHQEESDQELIARRVIELTDRVRRYQLSEHSQQCQLVLTRLAMAKVTLLDPDRKCAYDESLTPPPLPEPHRELPPIGSPKRSRRSGKQRRNSWLAPLATVCVLFCAALGLLLWYGEEGTGRLREFVALQVAQVIEEPSTGAGNQEEASPETASSASPTGSGTSDSSTRPFETSEPNDNGTSDSSQSTGEIDVQPVGLVRTTPTATNHFWMRGRGLRRVVDGPGQFSFLSMIHGHFQGDGERIWIRRHGDQEWYLSGQGATDVNASATTIEIAGAQFEFEQRRWDVGDPKMRLIHQDEGFCVLSAFGGGLHGGGEMISLYVGNDGYWYFTGRGQRKIFAEVMIVRTAYAGRNVEKYRWNRGDREVKMIHQSDGFCILSGFSGKFAGNAERVSVRLDPDGFWYLRCQSNQPVVAYAHAIGYR